MNEIIICKFYYDFCDCFVIYGMFSINFDFLFIMFVFIFYFIFLLFLFLCLSQICFCVGFQVDISWLFFQLNQLVFLFPFIYFWAMVHYYWSFVVGVHFASDAHFVNPGHVIAILSMVNLIKLIYNLKYISKSYIIHHHLFSKSINPVPVCMVYYYYFFIQLIIMLIFETQQ